MLQITDKVHYSQVVLDLTVISVAIFVKIAGQKMKIVQHTVLSTVLYSNIVGLRATLFSILRLFRILFFKILFFLSWTDHVNPNSIIS